MAVISATLKYENQPYKSALHKKISIHHQYLKVETFCGVFKMLETKSFKVWRTIELGKNWVKKPF